MNGLEAVMFGAWSAVTFEWGRRRDPRDLDTLRAERDQFEAENRDFVKLIGDRNDRIDALEAALEAERVTVERLKLALIEATNPGIDMEQVKQNREVMQAPGFRERALRDTKEGDDRG